MPAGTVACDSDARWITAVFFGMLHNVGDRAKDVFDQVGDRVRFVVAVMLSSPAIVDTTNDKFAALGQLASQAAHHVFIVGLPSATVNDDDDWEIRSSFG